MNLEPTVKQEEKKFSKGKWKSFLDKAKYAAVILTSVATLTCNSDLKKIYDGKNYGNGTRIYCNSDGTKIKIKRNLGIKRSEVYLFEGEHRIRSLSDLDIDDLRLVEYVNKPLGPFNNTTYDNKNNIVDQAFLQTKEAEGKHLILIKIENIENYIAR